MAKARIENDENPYAAPLPLVEQTAEPDVPQHWIWAVGNSAFALVVVILMSRWWFREFGVAGLSMLLGGFALSHLGWFLTHRWWGLLVGAVVGFAGGALVGGISLFLF